MAKIAVLGSGSWGLALAMLLNDNHHEVTVWSVHPDKLKILDSTRRDLKGLPDVVIPEGIKFNSNTEEVVCDADILVLSVASSYIRKTCKTIAPFVKDGQYIVDVAKGIEEGTLLTMCQVIEQELPKTKVTILSGPSHAEEVCKGLPTTCVVASHSKTDAEYIQNIFMTDYFRVYTCPDMLGVCIGGALKNVIALAAGIADGLGYGDNSKAALITRGITEIARLGIAMGADTLTFTGLSGIGDLIVTCASMHSRNRRAGILIGQGKTKDEAMEEVSMVVEGVYSAKAALELSYKYQVEMPIVYCINKVLFENYNPAEMVRELMIRDKKVESNQAWEEA